VPTFESQWTTASPSMSEYIWHRRHGSLLTFWRFTNRIIIIIIILLFLNLDSISARFWLVFCFVGSLVSTSKIPSTERVQALADIGRSALYCHSNETRAHRLQIRPIVHNYRAPLPFPKSHPVPCSSVGVRRGIDRHTHTDRHTDGRDQYTLRLGYVSRGM